MNKKYEFTNVVMEVVSDTTCEKTLLHQIISLIDIGDISAGTVGGFIESEENLSHDGNCWVGECGIAMGNSRVYEDAVVTSYGIVKDNANIHGSCIIRGGAVICNRAEIFGNTIIDGDIVVMNDARIGNTECSINMISDTKNILVGDNAEILNSEDVTVVYVCDNENTISNTVTIYRTTGGGWSTIEYMDLGDDAECCSETLDIDTVMEIKRMLKHGFWNN